jgi:hypothetical protein
MPVSSLENHFANLPFTEAINYLRQKINLPSDRYDDYESTVHDAAFIIAGAKGSLLSDLRSAVETAIAQGQRPDEFRKTFATLTEGWAHTGDKAWRANIILSTNLTQAYAAGRYAYQLDPQVLKLQPYLQYIHSDSRHPRPSHLALNLKVFPANELPFYPPSGFNCACRAISLSQRQVDQQGLQISTLKRGDTTPVELDGQTYNPILQPDKGFDYIPQQPSAQRRQQLLDPIIQRSPPAIAAQIRAEIARINQQFANGQP